MKRTELKRNAPLRSRSNLARTAMKAARSRGARRQDALRRVAYAVVDERSGGWCEAMSAGQYRFLGNLLPTGRCWNQAAQHHHRRPRRAGGSTDPTTETASNIVALCSAHHDGVESNRNAAYEMGLLIRAGHEPTRVPVLLHHGWVLLADDGTHTPTKETS